MAEKILIEQLEQEDKEYINDTIGGCFDMEDGYLYIPLAFARKTFELPYCNIDNSESIEFLAQLRPEQTSIRSYCDDKLKKDGHAIISARPGFGKTITSLAIACTLKVKTMIVVNKLVLINQWIQSIKEFTTARVQYVKPSTKVLDPLASLYIVNAINVSKKPRVFWSSVKFLIVDEIHQIVTGVLSRSLLKFVPRYILGLSATPYRFDEYDMVIPWFFGENKIGKGLHVNHNVYIIKTGWEPRMIRYTRKGLDWSLLLTEQCEDDGRNEIVVKSCMSYPNRTWLVLVKRIVHAEKLKRKFDDAGVSCATLVGATTTFNKKCKVLIGTTSKVGVGFDHSDIDALCIAADVKNYFVQFLGRCMRKPDVSPIVIDFEDSFGTLKKHLRYRIDEYINHGGIINI